MASTMKSRKQLNHLIEKLTDTIIDTPDAEILKEVEEDCGDSSCEADKVRELIKKADNQ